MNLVQRPAPDEAAILVLSEDGQLYDAFVAAEGANKIRPGPAGACFWLVAIDQAGNESERAGPVCPVKPADFEEGGCRCAHSPASSLGTILFGLLGLSMCARARRV